MVPNMNSLNRANSSAPIPNRSSQRPGAFPQDSSTPNGFHHHEVPPAQHSPRTNIAAFNRELIPAALHPFPNMATAFAPPPGGSVMPKSHVGFDSITNQIERKLLKRGFQFNVICVGELQASCFQDAFTDFGLFKGKLAWGNPP